MTSDERKRELEKICFMLGDSIRAEMNDASSGPPIGFCLLLFDSGPDGFLAYTSNANREDMIKLLREHLAHLEGRTN